MHEIRQNVQYSFREQPTERAATIMIRLRESAPKLQRDMPLILGGDFGERSDTISFDLLDNFHASGGVLIETGATYAEGAAELQIGRWLRKNRSSVAVKIIDKFGHPDGAGRIDVSLPALTAAVIASVERLGVSRIDIALLHRDNPLIDPAYIVEAFTRLQERGLIGAYGFTNWSIHRIQQALFAASRLGLSKPEVASLQYSLAVPIHPLWPGTLCATEADVCEVGRLGLAFTAWSAAARGWFSKNDGDAPADPIQRAFATRDNTERRRQAVLLGRSYGASPTAIALAYVLANPVVHAIIGPATVDELKDCASALNISLSASDIRNLRTGSQV